MTTSVTIFPVFTGTDAATGIPLAGGKLYTYDAGTNNPKATYSDAAGLIPNANPIILDSKGQARVRVNAQDGQYKLSLFNALDVLQWTEDYLDFGVGLGLFLQSGAGSVPRDASAKMAEWLSPQDKGARGDGIGDDTAALDLFYADVQARTAAGQSVGVRLYGNYLTSKSVKFAADNLHIVSSGATFTAKVGGTYDHCFTGVAGTTDSGEFVFFNCDSLTNGSISGRLSLNCSSITHLNGFGTAHNQALGGNALNVQWLSVSNAYRGVFTLDNGSGGLIGANFGTIHLNNSNFYPLWLVGNSAADVIINECRINSGFGVAAENVHIEEYGVVINALYCSNTDATWGPQRGGIVVANHCSLVVNHLYLEHMFLLPIEVQGDGMFTCHDTKVAASIVLTNSSDPIVHALGSACSVDMVVNRQCIGVAHPLASIFCPNSSAVASQNIRLRTSYNKAQAIAAGGADFFAFTGVGSFNGIAEIINPDGRVGYTYDGTTQRTANMTPRGPVTYTVTSNTSYHFDQDQYGNVRCPEQIILNNTSGVSHTCTLFAPDGSLLGKTVTVLVQGFQCTIVNDTNTRLTSGANTVIAVGATMNLRVMWDGSVYFWRQV